MNKPKERPRKSLLISIFRICTYCEGDQTKEGAQVGKEYGGVSELGAPRWSEKMTLTNRCKSNKISKHQNEHKKVMKKP